MKSRAEVEWEAKAAAARPLAEVLACTAATEGLLKGSAQAICFAAGERIFRQAEPGKGLYVVVRGCLVRSAMWRGTRVELGRVRGGELVELAAALGDGVHTYTLAAETDGMLLLLPEAALARALEADAGLRMRLLEELAREVSRGYGACRMMRLKETHRHAQGAA